MRFKNYYAKNEENCEKTRQLVASLPCRATYVAPRVTVMTGPNSVYVDFGDNNATLMSISDIVRKTMREDFWISNPNAIASWPKFKAENFTPFDLLKAFENVCHQRKAFRDGENMYCFDKNNNLIILSHEDYPDDGTGEIGFAFRFQIQGNNITINSVYKSHRYYIEENLDEKEQCYAGSGLFDGETREIWDFEELENLMREIDVARLPENFGKNESDYVPKFNNGDCGFEMMLFKANMTWNRDKYN